MAVFARLGGYTWLPAVLNSTAVEVPLFYRQVLLSLVVSIGIAWLITLRRKVSMHMMAQGGLWPCTHVALQMACGAWGGSLPGGRGTGGIRTGYLGAHTPREVTPDTPSG